MKMVAGGRPCKALSRGSTSCSGVWARASTRGGREGAERKLQRGGCREEAADRAAACDGGISHHGGGSHRVPYALAHLGQVRGGETVVGGHAVDGEGRQRRRQRPIARLVVYLRRRPAAGAAESDRAEDVRQDSVGKGRAHADRLAFGIGGEPLGVGGRLTPGCHSRLHDARPGQQLLALLLD